DRQRIAGRYRVGSPTRGAAEDTGRPGNLRAIQKTRRPIGASPPRESGQTCANPGCLRLPTTVFWGKQDVGATPAHAAVIPSETGVLAAGTGRCGGTPAARAT